MPTLKYWDIAAGQYLPLMPGPQGPPGPTGPGVPLGGAAGYALVKRSAADLDVGWAPIPGQVIANKWLPTPNYTNSSQTGLIIIDAANMMIPYTVPPSGNYLLRCTTNYSVGAGAAGTRFQLQWSSQATNNANLLGYMIHTGNVDSGQFKSMDTYITGGTPGAAMTAYLQWNAAGNANPIVLNSDPVIMQVIAL